MLDRIGHFETTKTLVKFSCNNLGLIVCYYDFSGFRHLYSTSSANELQKMVKTSSILGWNTIDKWKSRKDLLPPKSILLKGGASLFSLWSCKHNDNDNPTYFEIYLI